jgi:hypothetical protein
MTAIPNSNEMSPRQWLRIEAGFTKQGVQVWCQRCEANVVHIDFEGAKHPANTSSRRGPVR